VKGDERQQHQVTREKEIIPFTLTLAFTKHIDRFINKFIKNTTLLFVVYLTHFPNKKYSSFFPLLYLCRVLYFLLPLRCGGAKFFL
jgi:hypothetical protein